MRSFIVLLWTLLLFMAYRPPAVRGQTTEKRADTTAVPAQPSESDSVTLERIGVLIEEGQYAEAEIQARELLAKVEAEHGPESMEAAKVLDQLAESLWRGGKAADPETEIFATRALAIKENALGPDHPDVATSLSLLATLYKAQGKYGEAEPLYRRALAIREKALGPEHPDVASSLNSLANLSFNEGNYAEAEPLFRRALAIREKALGPDHPDVGSSLSNLATLCSTQGNYAEAESLFLRALAVREKGLGPDHPDVASSLNNLAIHYQGLGNYSEAEPLYLRALAICEKSLGPEHPDVAGSLITLASLFTSQGKYAKAEPLYLRALAILEKVLGPEHPDVAGNLNDLGNLYCVQGKYAEAEPLYRRALVILEKSMGPEHPDVAVCLNGLAGLYWYQGKYAEAEPLFRRALDIREKALGPEHPHVATTLNNLGNLYSEQGKYAEAEPLNRRAVAIWEKSLGPEHPDVVIGLTNLASLYSDQGKYAEADSLFERSIAMSEKTLRGEHPNLASGMESFGECCRLSGKREKAIELAADAFAIRKKNFRDLAPVMSETDALTYSMFLRNSANGYLSSSFDLSASNASVNETVTNVVLSTKGQASEGVFVRAAEMNMLALPGDVVDSLRQARLALSTLYVGGVGDEGVEAYSESVAQVNATKERIEKQLASSNSSYRNLQDALEVNSTKIRDILNLIPGNPTLVEYMKYDYLSLNPKASLSHYLVLVVDKDGTRDIMDLGMTSDIDPLIDRYRRHMIKVSMAGPAATISDLAEYDRISQSLYDRIWKPIDGDLAPSRLVMIAPDGGLNLVSFAGLKDESGSYLVERFPIHYLSSGRDLIRLKEAGRASTGLFALGDPDYDAPVVSRLSHQAMASDTSAARASSYASRSSRSGCGELKDLVVTPLPGTRAEVEAIAAKWEEGRKEPSVVCFGSEASEEWFKEKAPGSRIIHLATHGYFFEGACQPEMHRGGMDPEASFVGENPLLLSGLFLAGANLHGAGADSLGAQDGILTAEEVTSMNLTGTQLVVLSACETGLGEVRQGEGVYGLRRAFQVAGARTVLSALWPIPDQETAELMSRIYDRRGRSLPETLRGAQLERIEALRSEGKPDHPYSWGAFVALGDWR